MTPLPASPEHPRAAAAAADDDTGLRCPLCDYDVRGLSEERCPECGHTFDRRELRDWRDRQHPWLFEHHPRRNFASFARTFVTSLVLPRRFWRGVHAVNTPVTRRLALYLVLVLPLVVGGAWVGRVAPVAREYVRAHAEHAEWLRHERARIASDWRVKWRIVRDHGSVEAYLDNMSGPRGGSWWQALRGGAGTYQGWWSAVSFWPYLIGLLAWPGLTLAALMLFRRSLRQAHVRTDHVARCVVYAADALVLGGLVLVVSAAASAWAQYQLPAWWTSWTVMWTRVQYPIHDVPVAWPVMLAILGYRLALAYRLYLRFPHALATVLASQVLVALVLFKALLLWHGY